ncbi:hypothetical protein JMJ77_0008886, partial [Colletotrichum scovillei]
MGRLLDR